MVQKKSSITLSQAFEGMILSKQAEGKSFITINDYHTSFQKLASSVEMQQLWKE